MFPSYSLSIYISRRFWIDIPQATELYQLFRSRLYGSCSRIYPAVVPGYSQLAHASAPSALLPSRFSPSRTHFLLSLNWSTDPGGRRRRRQRRREEEEEEGGGRRRRREEGAGGGSGRRCRPAPPGRLSWARSRRARLPVRLSPRPRCSRVGPAPRALRAPPAPAPSAGPAGEAVTAAPGGGGGGSQWCSRGRRQPAAAGRPGVVKQEYGGLCLPFSPPGPVRGLGPPGSRGLRPRELLHGLPPRTPCPAPRRQPRRSLSQLPDCSDPLAGLLCSHFCILLRSYF